MEIGRGAEAVVTLEGGRVRKSRMAKGYRVPELDRQIRQERTLRESRIISEARRFGVPTPIICDISCYDLFMEHIVGSKLKDVITKELAEQAGEVVGRLHSGGIVHGDLTTSNMIVREGRICLIDFGLAYHDQSIEAQGVDVHVLFQTLASTHDRSDELRLAFVAGYRRTNGRWEAVLERVEQIKARGRYL